MKLEIKKIKRWWFGMNKAIIIESDNGGIQEWHVGDILEIKNNDLEFYKIRYYRNKDKKSIREFLDFTEGFFNRTHNIGGCDTYGKIIEKKTKYKLDDIITFRKYKKIIMTIISEKLI